MTESQVESITTAAVAVTEGERALHGACGTGTGCQRASATLAVSHKAHHLLRLVHK